MSGYTFFYFLLAISTPVSHLVATVCRERDNARENTCMTYGQILAVMRSLEACKWGKGTDISLRYCERMIKKLKEKDPNDKPVFVCDLNASIIAQAIFYGDPEVANAIKRIDRTDLACADPETRERLIKIRDYGHRWARQEFARIISQQCK